MCKKTLENVAPKPLFTVPKCSVSTSDAGSLLLAALAQETLVLSAVPTLPPQHFKYSERSQLQTNPKDNPEKNTFFFFFPFFLSFYFLLNFLLHSFFVLLVSTTQAIPNAQKTILSYWIRVF